MTWNARLALHYTLDPHSRVPRTVVRPRHEGPLRVLSSLYPEGAQTCHNVVVHPPGGIVGGDQLDIDVQLAPHTQAVIATPAATRFYRSLGPVASQCIHLTLEEDARLEWLPQETIVHADARAVNQLSFRLAPGASLIGWDILALGLPARQESFLNGQGTLEQCLHWPGVWLERCQLQAGDPLTERVLASPLGWDGHTVQASVWLAWGTPPGGQAREHLLEMTREALKAGGDSGDTAVQAAATALDARLIVVRALGARVEPVQTLLRRVRGLWREAAWQQADQPLRLWQT